MLLEVRCHAAKWICRGIWRLKLYGILDKISGTDPTWKTLPVGTIGWISVHFAEEQTDHRKGFSLGIFATCR